MKVINFWNVKGGVGKSSLSLLLARHLSSAGKRVLLLDLDGQRSISRVFECEYRTSMFDFLFDQCSISDVWFEAEKNLFVCPGSLKILKIQNSIPERKISSVLSELSKGDIFDFVVIDNAPTVSSLIAASVAASDILVIPTQISIFDFQEVVFTMDEAIRINPSVSPYVLLNRVQLKDRTTRDEREYLEMFTSRFHGHLLKSRIPNTIHMRRSIDRGGDPGELLNGILEKFICELTKNDASAEGCAGTPSSTIRTGGGSA